MARIYITGDIHGNPMRLSYKKFPEGRELTAEDFVIIAGDFGIIWARKPDREELYKLKWLEERPWTTLFIDGNHENFERLNSLPIEEKFGGKVGIVRKNVFHLKRGEIYDLAGQSFFCFGGAMSLDRDWRVSGVSYWEEEVPNCAEMDYGLEQLNKVNNKVDYVISHAPPLALLKVLNGEERLIDPTAKYLDHVANMTSFKKWYFGHMHVDKDMLKYKCLFQAIDRII